ncbi:uncharacterized protein LOC111360981 [Spodoptera litura]|uniref:Uncharacterized protein LOC111360981 n=1 Tax=Spodoptera litura TaxID=69820 RepID=A0A9J7EL65_SPOLT|nr:uncharacterized protein LOC111360981 [Spodoptera litura]
MTTVYMIIAITLMTIVVGLPPNCLQHCKSSFNKTIVLPECECSLYDPPSSPPTTLNLATPMPIKDSEIYYEPVEPNSFQKTHFDDQTLSMLSFNINLHSKPRIHNTTESNEHLRIAEYDVGKARELPLHVYLDLDVNTTGISNILQLENLKRMFMNFHTAEKNLSECINLYIYIFSKSIDINSKADSQQLTEIQNRCNHTASLIKESIYEIKQPLSLDLQQTYEEDTSGINFSDDITHTPSSYMDTTNTTDEYLRTHNTENIFENSTETIKPSPDIDYTSNLTENINKSHVPQYDTAEIETNRPKITDEEIKIPRILTKELSNGSLFSAVDGYEDITNYGFITASDSTSVENSAEIKLTTSNPLSKDSNVDDKMLQSGLIELHGRLYFSSGSINIPARFIQHSDGELNVAVDALSMCEQMVEENSSNFMNLLCKSIKLQSLN